MRSFWAGLIAATAFVGLAHAQGGPNWPLYYIPSPAEWQQLWTSKADVVNGRLVSPTIVGPLNLGATQALSGVGTPNGQVAAPPGSTYSRVDATAAAAFYVKESGAGNTGWVPYSGLTPAGFLPGAVIPFGPATGQVADGGLLMAETQRALAAEALKASVAALALEAVTARQAEQQAQQTASAAIPQATLNMPGGPAAQGIDGSLSGQTTKPTGTLLFRTFADLLRDRISIRSFVPAPACDGVTDDSPTLYAASVQEAYSGRTVGVPGDCRLNFGPAARLAGHRVILDGWSLEGEGGRDSGQGSLGYGSRGSSVLLTDLTACAFIARRNWSFRRLTFFWPARTEAATLANGGVPPATAQLVCGDAVLGGGSEVTAGEFADNDVVNGGDILDFHLNVSGGNRILHNRAFFTGAFLSLGSMPLEMWVQDNDFSPNAYQSVVLTGPTYALWNYAAVHAEVVRATNGSDTIQPVANANPTVPAQGLIFHHNYVFGLGYGLRAKGGWFDLTDVSDNTFDGVPHPLSVETGGAIDGVWRGGIIYSYTSVAGQVGPAATPALSWTADSGPGTDLNIEGVRIPSASGQFLDMENATNPITVTVDASQWSGGNGANTGVDAFVWKAPSIFSFRNGKIALSGSSTTNACINLAGNVQGYIVTGSFFYNCGYVMAAAGTAAGAVVANNVSFGTKTAIYGGQFPQFIPDGGNAWDKAAPGWQIAPRSSDGALVASYQGVAKESIGTAGAVKAAGAVTPSTAP